MTEITGYELSRAWFDFVWDNPSKVSANDTALFFLLAEIWNRLGKPKEFNITSMECCQGMGSISYGTYKKSIDFLIEEGFVILVRKSTNQHQSNIVAIPKNLKALGKAPTKPLDKASVTHTAKQPPKHLRHTLNQQPSTNNLEHIHSHEESSSNLFLDEEETEMQILIREKYPNVAGLKKQLTFKEASHLQHDFNKESLIEIMDAMENKKDLGKKYTSVNLTIRNWMKMRKNNPSNQNPQSKGKVYDRFDQTAREIVRRENSGE